MLFRGSAAPVDGVEDFTLGNVGNWSSGLLGSLRMLHQSDLRLQISLSRQAEGGICQDQAKSCLHLQR